jgi:hypothetical protein
VEVVVMGLTTYRMYLRIGHVVVVGSPYHSGNGDSQLWTLDSQLGSQLLAGKWLEWRSLNRDRHSHGCCLSLIDAPTPSFSPARLTSCTSAAVAVAAPITLSTSSPRHFHAPVMWLTLFPFIDATCNNNPLTNMNTTPTGVL